MKKLVLSILAFLYVMFSGCTDDTCKSTLKDGPQVQPIQTNDNSRFKLFPTQNMWTSIKLDTQTGQMWQIQYSIKSNDGCFECDLNPNPIITTGKKYNGRFELYPTQNIYNFILLDKIDGKTWQVQWSFDEENRTIIPINSSITSTN